MATRRIRRLSTEEIKTIRAAVIGIQSLHDYQPINNAYSTGTLVDLLHTMDEAHAAEIRSQQAHAADRSVSIEAEWAIYEAVQGSKAQVIAQYGPDSQVVKLLGLKRKSERRPGRRPSAGV